MMKRLNTAVPLAAVLLIAGCSLFVNPPSSYLKGPDVILTLVDPSDFKDSIAQGIADYAVVAGYQVEIDVTRRAKYYSASDFAAVIYMAEYWAWHVPWNATRYYRNNDEAGNIIFIITSGDPDVTIDKPFDAVTTASEPDRRNAVLREVYNRLDAILDKE